MSGVGNILNASLTVNAANGLIKLGGPKHKNTRKSRKTRKTRKTTRKNKKNTRRSRRHSRR